MEMADNHVSEALRVVKFCGDFQQEKTDGLFGS